MSALTFEILSTELTLALSEQSDIPPETTARCNLGRDKVMVLVEYPLDSAQAEPMASQTLDWLEAHLRNQFDTTGLPEEAADLAESGEEVPVQLFLKHRSEPKPFTMRSFIWKVDDGFDDIFGQPFDATDVRPNQAVASQAVGSQAVSSSQAAFSQTASNADEDTPVFRHSSEAVAAFKHTRNDQTQPLDEEPSDTASTLASAIPMLDIDAPELRASEIQAAELAEPVPSELDEEHLLLDLEPDLALDFDAGLGEAVLDDAGLGHEFGHEFEPELGTSMNNADLASADLASAAPELEGFESVAPSSGSDESLESLESLEVEASFFPVDSSPSSIELDDLAAGLTYPSASPARQTVDTEAAFDADLAAGVTSNRFDQSSSTELSLPGEAPTITSSEFDLPTVDLPVASEREVNASGDFFTFDQGDASSTNLQAGPESLGAELESETAFSQSTPALGNDLSVEFGLSPEEAPPVVDETVLDKVASDETGLDETGLDETGLDETGPDDTDISDIAADSADLFADQQTDAQQTDAQQTVSQSVESTSDDDDLHLFDLPTAAESLSDFDLPPDVSATESSTQAGSTETIEDYLSTEELPSDDLSSEEFSPEAPDSIDAYNLFDDPLMAEVDAASSTAADTAGPPSLDLSPLAYHILADESDEDDDDRAASNDIGDGGLADSGLGDSGLGDSGLGDGDAERLEADGYASDGDYDDYEDDESTYYLEDEAKDYEEPLEEVALIDDGEVERQRDQWQQQSKGNPWMFVGALGLVVLGVLGFVFTRPCSFGGQCDRIQTAQARGDEAIGNLRLDASKKSVNTSKQALGRAIQSLKPIPVWSPHYDDAQAILPEYEKQVEALELVTKALDQAFQAAVDSQNPPHSVSTWNGIAADWLAATQSLEAVPVDSPVRDLAERKLLEYRSNRATILVRIDAESKAEVSLRQSQQAATKATNLSKGAGTLQDWEDALAAWELAVDNLSQIPKGTNAHGEAQQILPGYLKQLEKVRDRTEQERSASRELFQAKQLAADAQRAQSEDRWTIAAQHWKSALSQLQDIPQGTLSHSEAQALSGLYTSALNNAESNLQIALRFQPVEPEFFAACGTTTAQKCTYSVRGGNVRLDLFQGYDNIIDQSITPPDQRVIVAANNQYVDPSNQLLRSITLLSTQAQVPIELYDAQGAFLARYRPDLNGFVREQG